MAADNHTHPCTHCARGPDEQAALNAWANQQFGGQLPLPQITARFGREAAYLTEFAVTGDVDLVADQLAMLIVLGYRIANVLDVDLWQRVTVKVQELQSLPDHEERF